MAPRTYYLSIFVLLVRQIKAGFRPGGAAFRSVTVAKVNSTGQSGSVAFDVTVRTTNCALMPAGGIPKLTVVQKDFPLPGYPSSVPSSDSQPVSFRPPMSFSHSPSASRPPSSQGSPNSRSLSNDKPSRSAQAVVVSRLEHAANPIGAFVVSFDGSSICGC